MLLVWHDSCWGLAVTRLSQVRHCNLGTMCRVCVTEKLIFIKRETNSPEVQLERLDQEGKESSEANLFRLYVAACSHPENSPGTKQIQQQTHRKANYK